MGRWREEEMGEALALHINLVAYKVAIYNEVNNLLVV
jgi:hypothetical protein